ncbi:MAG: diguanylate cyclase, partial [Cyanobacteria bacterium J06573_11]
RTWAQKDIATIHSITVELALALHQSQQHQELLIANQELQKLALSDGLTSLANRRRFDEHLADEWQRLARERQPLSLILCDLDHFKLYNDTFGHPAGDRCLIRVARALLSGPQRPADLVARYGGEEFAIILPNTDTHGAWRIAQKIHDSIRALQIDHAPGNEEPYVTVTMGVSTVIPGHENSAQMLVQASDLALYHAKQQGRNRTYVNGHYNTVNTKASKATAENEAELDVMLLDGE